MFISLAAMCAGLAYFIHYKKNAPEVVDEGGFKGNAPASGSMNNAEPSIKPSSGPATGASNVLPAIEGDATSRQAEPTEVSWDDVQLVDIIGLEVGYRLIPLVDKSQNGELLGRIKGVRKKLSQDVGFLVPAVHIRDN